MPLLKVPVTQSLQIPAIPAGSSESCCVWNGHAQRRLYSEASVLGITIYSCSSGSQLPPGETAGDLVVVARLGIVTRRELSGFACSYMCGPGGSAHGGMVRQVHDWWVIENAHAVQAASASLVSCSVYPWPAIQLAVTSAHGSTSVSPFHFPTGQLSHFGPLSVSAKPSPGGQSVMKLHDRERAHGRSWARETSRFERTERNRVSPVVYELRKVLFDLPNKILRGFLYADARAEQIDHLQLRLVLREIQLVNHSTAKSCSRFKEKRE